MPPSPPRRHSYHERSSPVFTDYAPHSSSVHVRSAHARLGNKPTPSKRSQSQKDLLSRMEDAAFTWCHNQLVPTPPPPTTSKSKMKTQKLPDRPPSPVIITSNPCLASSCAPQRIQIVPLLRSDDSTPSTLSSSASFNDQDTYAYSSATNSIEDETTFLEKEQVVSSSVPTLKRKTSYNAKFVAPHEQLAHHCRKLCLTTEGMLQQMLFDDLHQMQKEEAWKKQREAQDQQQKSHGMMQEPSAKEDQDQEDPPEELKQTYTLKHVNTIEDSTTSEESFMPSSDASSSTSYSGSEESSAGNNDVVQVYSIDRDDRTNRLQARFSSFWKKNIRERRHRPVEIVPDVEVEHPSPLLEGVSMKQATKVEVKLTEQETKAPDENTPKFRPIMTLRKLRQQKLEQEQQLQLQFQRSWDNLRYDKEEQEEPGKGDGDRFVKENKISVVEQKNNADVDIEDKDLSWNGETWKEGATSYLPQNLSSSSIPRKTPTGPFDESDADKDHDRRSSRLQRLMEYNRRKEQERKPFDEDSTSVDVVDHRHDFKIVGKWKEAGENDSDFYSVADTPFMKKADIYKPKEMAESDAEDSQLSEHLSFMKERTSPTVPIQQRMMTVKDIPVSKAPRSILKQEDFFNPQPQPKLSSLERKLGKKQKLKFQGVSTVASVSTLGVESSAVSGASSFNVPSTSAVFMPQYFDEHMEEGHDTFLKGEETEGEDESLGSLFATDESMQEQQTKRLNFHLD